MLANITSTNDQMIRSALLQILNDKHQKDKKVRIIEELGVHHGNGRVDIAVVNGVMHGYEIKSDLDTLQRLQEQIEIYNSVFDKMTIVVGKTHLFDVVRIIPEWWGIILAKLDSDDKIAFFSIRKEGLNKNQDQVSVAKLLWREEAIKILNEMNEANGFYSKPREIIYNKLAKTLDKKTLSQKVREAIFYRLDWRPESPLVSNDG